MNEHVAWKCKGCGRVMYPHHFRCLGCKGRDFDQIAIAGECSLVTFSEIESLPWGIDERVRILGVAEFPNGVKAMGWVKAAQATIGMKLQASWEPVRVIAGEEVEGLVFRPLS